MTTEIQDALTVLNKAYIDFAVQYMQMNPSEQPVRPEHIQLLCDNESLREKVLQFKKVYCDEELLEYYPVPITHMSTRLFFQEVMREFHSVQGRPFYRVYMRSKYLAVYALWELMGVMQREGPNYTTVKNIDKTFRISEEREVLVERIQMYHAFFAPNTELCSDLLDWSHLYNKTVPLSDDEEKLKIGLQLYLVGTIMQQFHPVGRNPKRKLDF
jgi:hypothetical protein